MPTDSHDVIWTRTKIDRFWDIFSSKTSASELHFGEMASKPLLKKVKKYLLGSSVLDIGFGSGALLKILSSEGYTVYGIEGSEDSIKEAKQSFANCGIKADLRSFEIPLPFESGFVENVFMTETLEHLLDDEIDVIFSEIHRVLCPNGKLIITVPNKEDLKRSLVGCPDCGAVFHKVQHINSWNKQSLSSLVESRKFAIELVNETILRDSFTRMGKKLVSRLSKSLFKNPNLVVVARKKQ